MPVAIVPAVALAAALLTPTRIAGYEVGVWDRTRAAPVDACDRLAAYQSDRDAVAPGVEKAALDMPRATAACRAAVATHPVEPRFSYQLARLLSYQGNEVEAVSYRRRAVAGGYPVALFVAGYNRAFGRTESEDRCAGAALIARAAQAGDFPASITYADEREKGSFARCPAVDPKDVAAWLAAARPKARGHYEERLVDALARHLTSETMR